MARLTRMQKYADLREQLSSSKEETNISQELKAYEDKLTNVQDTLTPKQPVEEDPRYIWNGFQDTGIQNKAIIEEVNEVPAGIGGNLNTDEIKTQEIIAEIREEPVVETNNKVEEKQDNQTTSSYFDSFFNEEKEESSTNVFGDFNSYFDNYNQAFEKPIIEEKDNNNQETYTSVEDSTANNEEVIDNSNVENENITSVFEDVKDNSDEIVSQKERDTYLNQTFSDVNLYNIDKGEPTIDKLLDNSIDEVRHPEQVKDGIADTFKQINDSHAFTIDNDKSNVTNEPLEFLDADEISEKVDEKTNGMDDDEFSNTVSLEITKIMEELSSTVEENNNAINQTDSDLNEEVIDQSDDIKEAIEVENRVIEEKSEEVVEIKNIAELEKDVAHTNTMSTTIPFVVTDENDSIEDDEENGSNTVLNVILIVLIVILVAVLGLIVFYILKTKGIF